MADIKPGLSELSTETEAATPDAGAMQITAPKSTGIAGKIALDPTQTEAILSNMQKYIDERQSPMNLLMGGINRAYATTYGPSALAAHDQQKNLEDKQIMDYRTQMAAYRAAQAQAGNEAERYKGLTPGVGGTQAGGVPISPEQLAIENSLGTAAEKLESRRKYLSTRNTEAIKLENAPAMRDIVDIYVPGEGNVQMTKAMAEKMLNSNPNLQAIVNGQKVPAASVISKMPTTATTAPAGNDNLAKIKSSIFGTESSSGKADTTKPGIQGAMGPMQITQDTWDTNVSRGIIPKDYDINNPAQNKEAGNRLLDYYYKQYNGDVDKTLAAYHGGEGAINPDGTINLNRKDKLGTSIGDYIAKNKTAMGLTSAPAEVVKATQVVNPNETRQQYEQRIKEESQIRESRTKEGEAKRSEILQARESSIETGNAIGRIENTLNTPEGVRAVGVFNKPGVVSAFGKILQEGIQAGNFGSVSFKGLEDAVRAAGGDQKTIDAAQRLARDFAQMQLNIAKRDLKGQGAVSDNERRIVEHVTGSASNSPEVLKEFTRWNRVRNTFDKQVGDALQNWEETHPNQSYTKFKQSDEYKKLENDYIAKTNEMASRMGIGGKKSTPSDTGNKANEYLKKYGPKKGS
jgi:hypothetical protein